MNFITILLSFCFLLFILDHAFWGIIPYLLNRYPRFRHLLVDVLIVDDTCNFDRSWNGVRYKSLILTSQYLILKNSYFTSLKNIPKNDLEAYAISEKGKGRAKVEVNFFIDGNLKKLKFLTKKKEEWNRYLSELIGSKEDKGHS